MATKEKKEDPMEKIRQALERSGRAHTDGRRIGKMAMATLKPQKKRGK